MAKTGTLPHYLYSKKISGVAETTEAYSADKIAINNNTKTEQKIEKT